MTPRHLLVLVPCLLAAACATPVENARPLDSRQQELREFQQAQLVFRQQYTNRHEFDFEGHGRVTVREISLDGFPGNTYVRCRFHYQNRTTKPVVQSWVSLDVLDADGHMVSTQSCHCIVPTSTAIERGAFFSDELRTPTYGAHMEPGWTWRIRCVADVQQAEEPLDPPVQEYRTRQVAPMYVRDRDWPYYR